MSGPVPGPDGELRCPWGMSAPEYVEYHDEEWGRPLRGDNAMFERLAHSATLRPIDDQPVWSVVCFYVHPAAKRQGVARALLAGAEKLLAELQSEESVDVRVVRAPCIGACDQAPACEVGHRHVPRATAATVLGLAAKGEVHAHIPAFQDFDAYTKAGGYAVLRSCLSGSRKAEEVIAALSDSERARARSLLGVEGAADRPASSSEESRS